MSPITEAIAGASTVVDAATLTYKGRHGIKYWFNRLFRRKINVLVYGDSGVGKTQFLLTITGNDGYYAPERTRHLQHFEHVLRSGRRIMFIDTPGHASSQMARKEALDDLTKGKVDGVINLVDYGYQDGEQIQKILDKVFQVGSSKVKPEYLRENQKLEIDRTKELVDRFSSKVKVNWFITLINKADVWNEDRDKVIEYYTEGEFKTAMENLEHAVSVTVCPFCSVITPFGNKTMLLTYGDREKRKDYDNLIKTIEEFIEGRHEQ